MSLRNAGYSFPLSCGVYVGTASLRENGHFSVPRYTPGRFDSMRPRFLKMGVHKLEQNFLCTSVNTLFLPAL